MFSPHISSPEIGGRMHTIEAGISLTGTQLLLPWRGVKTPNALHPTSQYGTQSVTRFQLPWHPTPFQRAVTPAGNKTHTLTAIRCPRCQSTMAQRLCQTQAVMAMHVTHVADMSYFWPWSVKGKTAGFLINQVHTERNMPHFSCS